MAVACLIVFTAQMATTIYLPALPLIERDFGVSRSVAALSVSLFVIGAAAPVVLWGRAADRLGRRAALLASLGLFAVSSAVLIVTTSPTWLLVLRALQGIGAGGAAIIARIAVRDLGDGDALAKRLSVLSIAFVTALGGGQFAGGLIGGWQGGFAVLTAAGVLCVIGTLTIPLRKSSGEKMGMVRIYLRILAVPAFLRPTIAAGLGFATIVLLQEVAPFVFQRHFGLSVEQYGSLGLLFGLAYFGGALLVNRLAARKGSPWLMRAGALVMTGAGALTIALWLVPAIPLTAALVTFIALYCGITFGQAALFPSSMAVAVSEVPAHDAYAVALCGFVAQSIAGVAATIAVLLHENVLWAVVVTVLSLAAFLLVRVRARE
ncbi:Predicted arabinose efflux permease, MFS family [Amycolatopsis lurida]|uniref:Major facilitator transporter n=2 Tax=Amycolatopsis lurida TaxID=31959 RepID=A0A2P2FTV3_AMYLU|nr:major facilitator transporter [Amycolatopsis lurida NRRL 2430]SEC60786.1 Predicted arabinose efflux permease, MFS family [Amycolatopsis lurida]